MDQYKSPRQVQPDVAVEIGTHVVIELRDASGRSERLEVDLVPDELADLSRGFLGAGTPLGRAITGHPPGSTLPYRQADIVSVRILSAAPACAAPDADAAEQREAALRRAVEKAQRTDAIVFASSFSGKWGDYDPQGMEHWEETDK